MEVAESTMRSAHSSRNGEATGKNIFWMQVLESKATSPLRVNTPNGHRMWNNKFKNADEQACSYARKALQWLHRVKHIVICFRLEVGHANTTGVEAVLEHPSMAQANGMKTG